VFADDGAPRYVTALLPLDYDTVAVADKFGNLSVLRLPPDVSAQVGGEGVHGVLEAAQTRRKNTP
jgi:splicing factor 3B subunit 3